MVVRRRKQIGQPLLYPLVFFKRSTKRAVSVATAMVLRVGMQAIFVAALVAMVAQIFGVTMMDPREYLRGIFIFRYIIAARK